MLLPSALSCGYTLAQPEPQRHSRPKLPSFERYDPLRRTQSPVYGLIASCRALQSIIGERLVPSPCPSPSINSTIRARPIASPFGEPTPPPARIPALRGVNKRTREDFDEETVEFEQNECMMRGGTPTAYATPKRRRIVPSDIPPGLRPADFEALVDSDLPTLSKSNSRTLAPPVDLPADKRISPIQDYEYSPGTWTEDDDRLLVQTVLSKLRLSSRTWNDCALRLGKDKDSLDHRWQLLLGEGKIGLRRGVGCMGRMDLDIRSWQ